MDPDEAAAVRQARARLRAGDVAEFTALYRAHVAQVHRLAASLCADATMAEDVTGETFLVAWSRRASIADSDESLGPWLLAIAARQSLTATRGRRRQRLFVARHGHLFDTSTSDIADQVSSRLDDRDRLSRTRIALAHLDDRSDPDRVVLFGATAVLERGVADALGTPPGGQVSAVA